MSLFPLPVVWLTKSRSCNGISSGGPGDEAKYHLVSWAKICSPISMSRQGFQNILESLIVRCCGNGFDVTKIEERPLWRAIVDSKYGCLCAGGVLGRSMGLMGSEYGRI